MTTQTTCPDCGETITYIDRIQTGDVRGNYLNSDGGCDCSPEWRCYEAGGGWDHHVRRTADGDWETVDVDVEDEDEDEASDAAQTILDCYGVGTDCPAVTGAQRVARGQGGEDLRDAVVELAEALAAEVDDHGERVHGQISAERIEAAERAVERALGEVTCGCCKERVPEGEATWMDPEESPSGSGYWTCDACREADEQDNP